MILRYINAQRFASRVIQGDAASTLPQRLGKIFATHASVVFVRRSAQNHEIKNPIARHAVREECAVQAEYKVSINNRTR